MKSLLNSPDQELLEMGEKGKILLVLKTSIIKGLDDKQIDNILYKRITDQMNYQAQLLLNIDETSRLYHYIKIVATNSLENLKKNKFDYQNIGLIESILKIEPEFMRKLKPVGYKDIEMVEKPVTERKKTPKIQLSPVNEDIIYLEEDKSYKQFLRDQKKSDKQEKERSIKVKKSEDLNDLDF